MTFVDVARKPPAATELRRFAARFGSSSLMDPDSRAYRDAGLAYMSMDEAEEFERALANSRLLRLPLVRAGNRLSIGVDEETWRSWLSLSD